MKREDLFEAIGDVDDMLLEENVAPAGKRSWMPFLVTAAACVSVAVGAAAFLPPDKLHESAELPDGRTLETAVMMTEPYFMGLPEDDTDAGDATEAETPAEYLVVTTPAEAVTTELPTFTDTSEETAGVAMHTLPPDEEDTNKNTNKDTNSFRYVLTQIYENRSYMGLSFNTYPASDMTGNQFAVYDVDGDGEEELVFLWKETDMASMLGIIYGHDEQGAVTMEFWGNPFIHIYSNGLIKHDFSHNQGLDGRFWPYTLCRYDPVSDTYETEYSIGAWDSEVLPAPEEAYPEEADVSGFGIVYYVGERGPLDVTEFRSWEQETFGDAYELDLPFQSFTEEHIASVQN